MPLKKAGAGSRRDRHSKILTQQGPRDRRMRLSLEIARKFFRLQDTLGFDKASKTVAWLLNNSKAAITEVEGLARRSPSPSFTSEYSDCQVMVLPGGGEEGGGVEKSCGEQKEEAKKKKVVLARKAAAFDHPLAKEWRATARAKARERTKKKMSRMMESSAAAAAASSAASLNDYDDHHSSSSSGLVIKEQQLGTEPIVSNPFAPQAFLVDDVDDEDDESIKPSAAAADHAPMINPIFDYRQHYLSQGLNSVNHLGSFENHGNMMINFFPDNWGELGGPSHTQAPATTALLFKASADHHVQFCPKSLNNNAYNNQSL